MKNKRTIEKSNIVIGYRANGYNAMYDKTTFIVKRIGGRLEITDTELGITFILNESEECK